MTVLPSLSRHLRRSDGVLPALLLLLLSFFHRLYLSLRRRSTRSHKSGHRARVLRVAAALRRNRPAKRGAAPSVVRPARDPLLSQSMRAAGKRPAPADAHTPQEVRVDMDDFNAVLHVDLGIGRAFVRVEPFVTVGEVLDFLDGEGYMLENCVDRRDATVGGLLLSSGVTSHSHVAGMLHDTCQAYELLTADGTLVRATATNDHAELFHAIPGSHGSLGLLVAAELRIIPCPDHVCVAYFPTASVAECHSVMQDLAASDDPPWFLEAFVFSKSQAVVVSGRLATFRDVTSGRLELNTIEAWYKPWFYERARAVLEKVNPGSYTEELISTREYLMRHDRSLSTLSGFLCPEACGKYFRLFFGWLCPPSLYVFKCTRSKSAGGRSLYEHVFQNFCIPSSCFLSLVEWADEHLGVYPLHVYPCAIFDRGGLVRHRSNRGKPVPSRVERSLYLDVAINGALTRLHTRQQQPLSAVSKVQELCENVSEVGGFARTGADLFISETQFMQMFDHTLWRKMRGRYRATGVFPSVYEKLAPEVDPSANVVPR